MRTILFLLALTLHNTCIAQTDSTVTALRDSLPDTLNQKIYKSKILTKGFYKNKDEYFNNAPSITRNFTVKEETFSSDKKKAGGILSVTYVLADGDPAINEDIWGFCDGKDAYIYYNSVFGSYWKLDCIGPCPYFIYGRYHSFGLLDIIAGYSFEVYMMNKKGKFKRADSGDIVELFEDEPDLQYGYRKALGFDIYEPNLERSKITRQYLKKFNERLIENE